jgi:hypothetical protein
LKFFLVFVLLCYAGIYAQAQIVVQGHIYGGVNKNSPVDSMRISTASGKVTYTDKRGFYIIIAEQENDTLRISYQKRDIIRYPVKLITTPSKFDVYLNNPAFYDTSYARELPQVQVLSRKYQEDSLYNRDVYSKVFDYTKPRFNPFSPITSTVNLFRKPYIHRQQRYRKFAEFNEQSGYVQSRFTRSLVAKYSGIKDDDELTKFMKEYEPSYAALSGMNDLELAQYIIDSYKKFKEEHKNESN